MNQQHEIRFIKLQEVSLLTTLGKSTILAWEAKGNFPKAIRLSKTLRVWLLEDIQNWISKQSTLKNG
jgi:predicted DNA-binding transcriptional regulator AlpA